VAPQPEVEAPAEPDTGDATESDTVGGEADAAPAASEGSGFKPGPRPARPGAPRPGNNPDFVVRQVFMRDFDEEMALLHDLQSLCERFQAVASFNGKTFDLPLLENRFVIARLFSDLFDGPHLDLLHPSRRLWRRRLENCKLSTLEAEILGVERSQADIPGYFIPSLYRKYLVDRDARAMAGIFYHNELDIVSMASLAAALGRHFAGPDQPDQTQTMHPVDLLSLGLWQQHLGDEVAAEASLTQVRSQSLTDDLQALVKTELAALFKRQGRLAEAEPLWQELVLGSQPLTALEELAKYYEWQRKDFESALNCIDYALKILPDQLAAWQVKEARASWEHRRNRVQRKAEKTSNSS
jgi:tetratricopeptide (TPR) repeat protein